MSYNYKDIKLVLASASPRRRELIQLLGLPFECTVSEADESTCMKVPDEVVKEISRKKALWVYERRGLGTNEVLIGADTVVAFENNILGKPASENDARTMLRMLQGNVHSVFTGVTLIWMSDNATEPNIISFAQQTDVTFSKVSDNEIEEYLFTRDYRDKAGSYGIQGPFGRHVQQIHGDYNNVVGFPVNAVYEALKKYCCK